MKTLPNVKIRAATLKDSNTITWVHCSDVTTWYRHVDDEKIEDAYENLSLWDRYLIGGPWMSPETCAVHLNFLLSAKQYALVAEINNKVVGEIEVFIGEEPSPFKRNACISVLEVAKDYRGKGVGRALVNESIRMAGEHNCDVIITVPEENAVTFYRKCGFDEVLMELHHLEIDLRFSAKYDAEVEVAELSSYKVLKEMQMVLGRYDSSFKQWLERRWELSFRPSGLIWEEGFLDSYNAAYRIESRPLKKSTCYLLAWTKNPPQSEYLLEVCARRAMKLGFQKLETTIRKDMTKEVIKTPFSILHTEIIIGKRLKNIAK